MNASASRLAVLRGREYLACLEPLRAEAAQHLLRRARTALVFRLRPAIELLADVAAEDL